MSAKLSVITSKSKAILFDFDGVIADSELIHMRTFFEILSETPFAKTIKPISIETWFKEYSGTGSHEIFKRILKDAGVPENAYDLDNLVKRRHTLFLSYLDQGLIHEKRGFSVFFKKIKSRGIKTAIVSGGHSHYILRILEKLGLNPNSSSFDAIVTSESTKERKPNPGPFLFAAKKLGVEPKDCLVIEDSVSGSIAAKRAGMRLVVMKSPAAAFLYDFDLIINNFTEFPLEELL